MSWIAVCSDMNYSNHDNRKKKLAQPTGRKYPSVTSLMTGEGISPEVQQIHTDYSSSDTSGSDTSSSHCGSSDCGGSSDGGGCGGGGE